ncbi:MAG: acyl-CoA thioesterase [Pseudomonadota bacterium]
MNLFFRLLSIYFRATFGKRRIKAGQEDTLRFRVWFTDQDLFGHMTNSRYLSFSDLGTINYIIRSGFWKTLRRNNWFPVITAQSMTIHRMLTFPQTFEVITTLVGADERYAGLRHEFIRDGRKHATVDVVARFVGKGRQRITPQALVDAAQSDYRLHPLPLEHQRLVEGLETHQRAKVA